MYCCFVTILIGQANAIYN